MSIPVSAKYKALFRKGYRVLVEIMVDGVEGLSRLTDTDIVEDGFYIDRYCFPSDELEIGTAIEAEAEIILDNSDGRLNAYHFDGARLTVLLTVKKWDARKWENAKPYTMYMGCFTVDDVTKNKSTITLCALDDMAKFDAEITDYDLQYPATLAQIANHACDKCGVLGFFTASNLTNGDFVVAECPDTEGLTWRQLISWVAELAGGNAFVNHIGRLLIQWFTETDITLSPSDRYDPEIGEYTLAPTGICFVSAEDVEYVSGTADVRLTLEGNKLAQGDLSGVVATIHQQVCGFSYLTYSTETCPLPFLMPMDLITYIDTAGGEHKTVVTNITYTPFGHTVLEGRGRSKTESGYSRGGGLTRREQYIIDQAKKKQEQQLKEQYASTILLNDALSGALGLYLTEETSESGAKVYYYHNQATLADSTCIYTFNDSGFAFTSDWNDGDPVWEHGMTSTGNAILNALYAHKIKADMIDAEAITTDHIAADAVTAEKIKVDDLSALNATIGGWKIGEDRLYSENVGLYSGTAYSNQSLISAYSSYSGITSPIKIYAGETVENYRVSVPLTFSSALLVSMTVDVEQSGGFFEVLWLTGVVWNDTDITASVTGCSITQVSDSRFELRMRFAGGTFGDMTPLAGKVTAYVDYQYNHGVVGSQTQILDDGSFYTSAMCVSSNPLKGKDAAYNVLIRDGKIRVKSGYINPSDAGYTIPLLYFKTEDDRLFAVTVGVLFGGEETVELVVSDTLRVQEIGNTDII